MNKLKKIIALPVSAPEVVSSLLLEKAQGLRRYLSLITEIKQNLELNSPSFNHALSMAIMANWDKLCSIGSLNKELIALILIPSGLRNSQFSEDDHLTIWNFLPGKIQQESMSITIVGRMVRTPEFNVAMDRLRHDSSLKAEALTMLNHLFSAVATPKNSNAD